MTTIILHPWDDKIIQTMIEMDDISAFIGLEDLHRVRSYHGDTLLHVAFNHRSEKCSKYLIENTPSIMFEKDRDGITPLEIAIRYCIDLDLDIHIDIFFNMEYRNEKGDTIMHTIVENCRDDLLEKILPKVQSKTELNFLGETPVHYAIIYRSIECLILLLEYGADPFYKKYAHYTSPYEYAKYELMDACEEDIPLLTKMIECMEKNH